MMEKYGNKFNTTMQHDTMQTIMKALLKTTGWLVMAAALTFGFASCSSDDDAVDGQQSVNPTGKYTMTVKATKGDADTRALSLNGTSVDVFWNAGEIVDVYQEKNQTETKIGTLYATASSTAETTLTGTLDAPVAGKTLYFYLHGRNRSYSSQNGALTGEGSIEENQDFAEGTVLSGDFTIDGTQVKVPKGLSLTSLQAIVKFTLKDAATDQPLYVRSLTVTDEALNLSSQDENPSFILGSPLTITPDDATNELYVAISGLNKVDKHSHLVLTATGADGKTYIYAREYAPEASIYFTHGNYYTRTVKMKKGFTTFSENSVIQVGDPIRLTQEWDVNNHSWYLPAGKTGTLVRANIDDSGNVTEDEYGAYYVIKYVYHDLEGDDPDYTFYFFDDKSMPVGKTSDGLVVKNVDVSGTKPTCTIGVNGYYEVWKWKPEDGNMPPAGYFSYYFSEGGVTLSGVNGVMLISEGLVDLGPGGNGPDDPDVSETSFTFSAPAGKKFVEIKMIFETEDDAANTLFESSGWRQSGNTLTCKPSGSLTTEVAINPRKGPDNYYRLDIHGIESIVFTLADDI